MAQPAVRHKRKALIGQMILFGAVSSLLYLAVFTHSSSVMEYFTKGGYYAALPVATVFIFSFIHGTFASKLWSVLGIEAVIKSAPRPAERPATRTTRRPDTRPRLRA